MFTLTQLVAAPPAQVVRAFTEPEPFAAWFVAAGFRTPADRVRIDARSGGSISAVFVAQADGTEVPFTLRFGELDLPRQVVLHLEGPTETITVDLHSLPDGGTRLEYRSTGLPADQEPTTKAGVTKMLGLLASYFATGAR